MVYGWLFLISLKKGFYMGFISPRVLVGTFSCPSVCLWHMKVVSEQLMCCFGY